MNTDRSTNFFARQARARKNGRRQLIAFFFAVAVIVLVTTLAIRLAWYLYVGTNAYTSFNAGEAHGYQQTLSTFMFFDPAFFIFMSMAIVIVILSASIYKMHTLKKGGAAVAEMLGARRVNPGATNPSWRKWPLLRAFPFRRYLLWIPKKTSTPLPPGWKSAMRR